MLEDKLKHQGKNRCECNPKFTYIYTPELRDIPDTVRLSECELIFRTSLNENREHRADLYSSVHAGTQLRTTM